MKNDEEDNIKYKIKALEKELKELGVRKKSAAVLNKEFSGQFNVRIKKSLHKALVYEAIHVGCSLNSLIESRLLKSILRDKKLTEKMDGWDNE